MKRKFSMLLMALMSIAVLALAGCSDQKFSEEKEKEWMDAFIDQAMDEKTKPNELVKKLDKDIKRLSESGASDAVDGLLYNMYQKMTDLNEQVSGFQTALAKLAKDDIDVTKAESIEKVEDSITKAFLKELDDNGLKLMVDNDKYQVVPDMTAILTKYEKYIADDLIAMIKFSEMEYKEGYYNAKDETFDLDIIRERILTLEKAQKEFPESYYIDGLKDAFNYYYQIYFGVVHSVFKDENGKIVEDVLKHYKETVEKHPDTQFVKDIQTVVDMLAESNNVITDNIMVALLDLTNYKTQTYSSEEADGSAEEASADKKDKAGEPTVTDVEGGTILEGEFTSEEDLEETINNFIKENQGSADASDKEKSEENADGKSDK